MNLSSNSVESNARLGPNQHGNGDYDEILQVEKNALEDEKVKEAIKKLQLPKGTAVCADPWIYGMVSATPCDIEVLGLVSSNETKDSC